MANDDFLLRGSLRRIQVVRQFVREDDESAKNAENADKLPITQGNDVENADKLPISDVQIAENAENVDEDVQQGVSSEGVDSGEGGSDFVIKIDEESPNWIQEVRESGGGLTAGPADGVIAKPSGVSDERFAARPEEPEPEEEEPQKTLDEFRAEGRKILDGEADEEFEAEVQRTMGALQRLMANVERSFGWWRKK